MSKERLDYIDIAKGILIILVVIGHLFPAGYFRDWVYGFHVQAFFVLSGICVNHSKAYMSDFPTFLRRKLTTILKPMLLFELAGVIGHIVRFGFRQKLTGIIYDAVALYFNNVVNWYLFALLFAEILLYALSKSNRYVLSGVSILCLAMSFILPDNHLFAVTSWILIAFSGITTGKILERKIILMAENAGALGVAFIITLFAAYYNGGVSIYDNKLGHPMWFILSSAAGTILVLGLAQLLEKYEFVKAFKIIGINSLYIMGLHLPIRNILIRIFGKFSESVLYNIVAVPLIISIIIGARNIIFINRDGSQNETRRDS